MLNSYPKFVKRFEDLKSISIRIKTISHIQPEKKFLEIFWLILSLVSFVPMCFTTVNVGTILCHSECKLANILPFNMPLFCQKPA